MLNSQTKSKQIKCQAGILLSGLVASAFFYLLSMFTSCQKNGSESSIPKDIKNIADKNLLDAKNAKLTARKNLSILHSNLKSSIVAGMKVDRISEHLGNNVFIVAEKKDQNNHWKVLKYMWRDVVENSFSSQSEEFRICSNKKNILRLQLKTLRLFQSCGFNIIYCFSLSKVTRSLTTQPLLIIDGKTEETDQPSLLNELSSAVNILDN